MNRLRLFIISLSLWLMGWNDHLFVPSDINGPIEWRDHVRWKLDDWLSWLFAVAYDGSQLEIQDALDDNTPEECWSQRQREAVYGINGRLLLKAPSRFTAICDCLKWLAIWLALAACMYLFLIF